MATDLSSDSEPKLIHHFKGHKNTITSLAFNPTSNQIASASLDHSVHLWNFDTKAKLRCYKFLGHCDATHAVAWSPSGELMATASADRTARVWVPTVQGSSGVFRAHTSTVRCVDFNPSGRKVFLLLILILFLPNYVLFFFYTDVHCF